MHYVVVLCMGHNGHTKEGVESFQKEEGTGHAAEKVGKGRIMNMVTFRFRQ